MWIMFRAQHVMSPTQIQAVEQILVQNQVPSHYQSGVGSSTHFDVGAYLEVYSLLGTTGAILWPYNATRSR